MTKRLRTKLSGVIDEYNRIHDVFDSKVGEIIEQIRMTPPLTKTDADLITLVIGFYYPQTQYEDEGNNNHRFSIVTDDTGLTTLLDRMTHPDYEWVVSDTVDTTNGQTCFLSLTSREE